MLAKPVMILISLTLFATAGCSSNAGSSRGAQQVLPDAGPAVGHPVSQYISHVIVIVQENRTFENFFAGFPGANAPMTGCVSPPSGSARLSRPGVPAKRNGSSCPPGDTNRAAAPDLVQRTGPAPRLARVDDRLEQR